MQSDAGLEDILFICALEQPLLVFRFNSIVQSRDSVLGTQNDQFSTIDNVIGFPIIGLVVEFRSVFEKGHCVSLAEILRECVLADASISEASRGAGVPQPTLQEFAVGRSDGSFADIRLSSAQKLINYYGINKLGNVPPVVPKRSRRMLLSAELEASECQDSPEKFKERLIDGIVVQFPGQTIDGLLCSPLDALAYCDRIREGVGSECLADFVILKALMNVRKSKNCPAGLKQRRTRAVLRTELASIQCPLTAVQFREMVVDTLAGMYRDRTIDELVCQPREARMLCNAVRHQSRCDSIKDQLVLSTLMNVRRAG